MQNEIHEYITIVILALFFTTSSVFAQEAKSTDTKTKEEVRKKAFEKPLKMMVQWMKDNLELSEQQEKELLDFYLSTPVFFRTMDNSTSDDGKEESMAKQEAKLREVLTAEQLEKFLSRKDEAQSVLIQNLPRSSSPISRLKT